MKTTSTTDIKCLGREEAISLVLFLSHISEAKDVLTCWSDFQTTLGGRATMAISNKNSDLSINLESTEASRDIIFNYLSHSFSLGKKVFLLYLFPKISKPGK